jgi:hypothetical protein
LMILTLRQTQGARGEGVDMFLVADDRGHNCCSL